MVTPRPCLSLSLSLSLIESPEANPVLPSTLRFAQTDREVWCAGEQTDTRRIGSPAHHSHFPEQLGEGFRQLEGVLDDR